jgi:hypothetical protein
MVEKDVLTKETFHHMARVAGFDPQDPHLDRLFPEVQALLAVLQRLREQDDSGEEPSVIFRVTGEARSL